MTKEQLNALINLGFSGEQILAINDAGKAKAVPNANVTPTPTPNPTPNPNPNPNTPAPDPNATPTPNESETVKMLKEMLGLMRAGNINGIGITPPVEKDASDILAEIIDPE